MAVRGGVGLGGWYRLAVALPVPFSRLFTRRDWYGLRTRCPAQVFPRPADA